MKTKTKPKKGYKNSGRNSGTLEVAVKKLALLLITLVVLPISAHASGYALYEMSAAAHGQAHAYITRVDDPSAVWYNPAALTRIEGTDLYASGTWISTSGDHVDILGNRTDMDGADALPVNIYGSYPINDRMVFGAGFYSAFGLITEWPENSDEAFINKKADLKTFYITPAIGYKLNNYVSIGGGVDIVFADFELNRNITLAPAAFTFANTVEGSETNFGFNLGVLVETDYNFTFAATYKHSMDLDFKGDATFSAVPPPVSPLFPDGEVEFSLPIPSQFSIGAATTYENWSFEGDLIFTQWETLDGVLLDFVANTPGLPDQFIQRDYRNTFSIRLGTEYQWSDAIAFRGGYFFDQTPVPNKAVDPILPDGGRNGITFGVGYTTDLWNFDVGYMILLFEKRTAPPNNFTNPPGNLIAAGTYNNNAGLLSFGFGYKF